MFQTLAARGEGLHVSGVHVIRHIALSTALIAGLLPAAAAAQINSIEELLEDLKRNEAELAEGDQAADAPARQTPRADAPDPDDPRPLPFPGTERDGDSLVGDDDGRVLSADELAELRAMDEDEIDVLRGLTEDMIVDLPGEGKLTIEVEPEIPDAPPSPDYSKLPPKAERAARLDVLHERLAVEDDKTTAELISEEIWAIWMDSGSASVNYLMVRADEAMKRGDTVEGARMIDLMIDLEPGFAEAWSRSARVALMDEDYSRAAVHATEALIRNPRHFYALWTLGNVLERLNRDEEALQVYEEAHALFPMLGNVKDRLDALRSEVLGDVL